MMQNQYLIEDLRRADAELKKLDAERRDLEARREVVVIRRDAVRAALGSDGPFEAVPSVSALATPLTPLPEVPVLRDTHPRGSNGHDQGGIRCSIREVLREANGKGMKTRAILEKLVERGITFTGKVEPVIRTSNELYRMAKKHHLRRRGRLFYLPHGKEEGG